ncbi:MAG: hypothetical protein AAB539_04585 [Patescibacteria group bacterium]
MDAIERKWADEFRQWRRLGSSMQVILVDHRVNFEEVETRIQAVIASVQQTTPSPIKRVKVIPHEWIEDCNFISIDILFEPEIGQSFCQIYDRELIEMIQACVAPSLLRAGNRKLS